MSVSVVDVWSHIGDILAWRRRGSELVLYSKGGRPPPHRTPEYYGSGVLE